MGAMRPPPNIAKITEHTGCKNLGQGSSCKKQALSSTQIYRDKIAQETVEKVPWARIGRESNAYASLLAMPNYQNV